MDERGCAKHGFTLIFRIIPLIELLVQTPGYIILLLESALIEVAL